MGSSIVGKQPVIAIRVPRPLHETIKRQAKRNGRSMSEEAKELLRDGVDDGIKNHLDRIAEQLESIQQHMKRGIG